ncbi:MAG: penicillin-insensitive murein endopeptidase [Bacteroidota bacterium]
MIRISLYLLLLFPLSLSQAQSISKGTPGNGSLKNAAKLPYKGIGYRYFSPLSYYVLQRGFVHEKVRKTIQQAYQSCHEAMPERKFRLMECSKRKGGPMKPHRTHQNGMSVDFMTPLQKQGKAFQALDRLGIWHYLLTFDSKAQWRINRKVKIDYETMARHILAVADAAKQQGLKIKKVIFKVELQPALFQGFYGKKLKRRGIYFVRKLSPLIDNLHDDHYHIDFALK